MKMFKNFLPLVMFAGFLTTMPVFAAQNNLNGSHNSMNQQSNYLRAKDLLGKDVKGSQGKNIGKVADLIFGKNGDIDFVVISHAKGMLSSSKYVPIPYKTFISSATNLNNIEEGRAHGGKAIKTNLTRARLDKAPQYTTRHWNIGASRQRICNYYGKDQCSRG